MIISIIITTYNSSSTIERALNSLHSIKKSSNNIFNIIVVDDCSTDNTIDIIKNYDFVDKLIIKQINTGVSNSRNIGINYSLNSDYLTFLDSDDEFDISYLRNIVFAHSYDLILFPFYVIENNKISFNSFYNKSLCLDLEEQKKYLCKFLNVPNKNNLLTTCWSKLYNVQLIINKGIQFNEKLVVCEDTNFVLEFIYNATDIHYFNDYFYKHIISGNGDRGTFNFSGNYFNSLSFIYVLKSCKKIMLYKLNMESNEVLKMIKHCFAAYFIIYMIRTSICVRGLRSFIKRYYFYNNLINRKMVVNSFNIYSHSLAEGNAILPLFIKSRLCLISNLYSIYLYFKRYNFNFIKKI